MSAHKICFCGETRKIINTFWLKNCLIWHFADPILNFYVSGTLWNNYRTFHNRMGFLVQKNRLIFIN